MRLIKIIVPLERYSFYVRDAEGERDYPLESIPSLEELLATITFPIIEISYYYGVNAIFVIQLEVEPTQLPIEFITVNLDDANDVFALEIASAEINLSQECLKNYELKKYLGKGTYGSVYQACLLQSSDCKYAVKLVLLGGSGSMLGQIPASFVHEVAIIKELSANDVGPTFFDAWICKTNTDNIIGCIVTELWSGELAKNECLPPKLVMKLKRQIQTIHDLGYIHGDIFIRNVLVKRRGKAIIDVTLTDFGIVDTMEQWKNRLVSGLGDEFYNNQVTDPYNKAYMNAKEITLEDIMEDPQHLDQAFLYYLEHCKK